MPVMLHLAPRSYSKDATSFENQNNRGGLYVESSVGDSDPTAENIQPTNFNLPGDGFAASLARVLP